MITGGALAVSVLSLAAGGYFGLEAFSAWAERDRHCSDGVCDDRAVDARDRAARAATWSNTFFALGAATGAVGAYLVVREFADTTRQDDRSHPPRRESSALLVARGRF